MSDEEFTALPEAKALLLIRGICQEENKLKKITADERTVAWEENIAPKANAFFEYIRFLEESDSVFSDRMKKAIIYALNRGKNLRRFLAYGNIPCDNGHVERILRSYSVGRANWQKQQHQSLYGQLFPEPERPRMPGKEIGARECQRAMF